MSVKALQEYEKKYCVSEILTQEFLDSYQNRQPKWGFNGLGYVVYKRTYARKIEDGLTEEWWQTVARCINGSQKIGADYTKKEAERLFDLIFNLKCNFAGRMLWQLGTSTVDKFGANSLLNCWTVQINEIKAFSFLFENLMLGGGVGFSIRREDVHELPRVKRNINISHDVDSQGKPTKDADFIVPDSREGWVGLLKMVLDSYFNTEKSFSYSTILVRPEGDSIDGFGGTASGPKILIKGISQICNILENREGKKIRSIDALDICNIIGSIVVAGNVRRCLPEDSKIFLKNGIKEIKNIKVGDQVLTPYGYREVLNNFDQGIQKTINIKTQDGYFECTPNHKIAVIDEYETYKWVRAEDLRYGDRLITNTFSLEGQRTGLPEFEYIRPLHSTTCKDITIPRLDSKMAWFIGLFHGDGYVYFNPKRNKNGNTGSDHLSIVFGLNEYECAVEAKKQIERFGVNAKLQKRKGENSYIIRSSSKQLTKYFFENIKQPNVNIKIPEFIWNASEEIKKSYLRGLFDSDGAANNKPVLLCTSAYECFSKDLQILAYSCGIGVRLTEGSDNWPSRKGWKKLYHLGLIHNKDKNLLISNSFGFKEPKISELSQKCDGYDPELIKSNELFVGKKSTMGIYSNKQVTTECLVNNGFEVTLNPVKVIEIENGRTINTFDIEVEEDHQFYCNGYLTHNSAEVALGDPDDYLYLRAKRWDLGNIPNWRTMSNNTIYCDDFSHTSEALWQGFNGNGEPYGLFNLPLSQTHGRLMDGPMKNNDLYPAREDNCVAGNPCMEVTLSNYECCNLSELYLNNVDSKEELLECAKLIFKTQKAICAMPFIHEETNKIVHKNMRTGLGVTGICQSGSKLKWLDFVYKGLREFDKELSKEKGLPRSIKITTVKPSGTLSLLAGATPGVHPAYSKFYIRRVRMSSSDSLVEKCKEMGYHVEFSKNLDGSLDHSTVVVEFPCFAGESSVLAKDMSAIDQLELVKQIQSDWSDNAVSVTVYYKIEELKDIKDWLSKNYENSIKSVSFLLHSEHGFEQAPYEEIEEKDYLELSKDIKEFSDLGDVSGDVLDGVECENGVCPIK